ncbi:glycosyltransferase family 2 protein [Nibricoccus aquaticus]|nr:glycosyltransferase family 2 protein [Nibricoccus aquaticus]
MEPLVAIVIPAYKVRDTVLAVIESVPASVARIYVVDDACPQESGKWVEAQCRDARVVVLTMEKNGGVGAATLRGFNQAFADGAEIAVKLDGDGQMRVEYLPDLLAPILAGRVDFAKGNRFFDLKRLRQMPVARLVGNIGLSLLVKFTSGHWHIADPTNGFIAIHRAAYVQLSEELIAKRFFFETSLLVNLNIVRATVLDVPVPARYGDEVSNLSVMRSLLGFPPRLLRHFFRRLLFRYCLLDINAASVFFALGTLLFFGGASFAIYRWHLGAVSGVPQTSGTVALALTPTILGAQMILQAILIDIITPPAHPLQSLYRPHKK